MSLVTLLNSTAEAPTTVDLRESRRTLPFAPTERAGAMDDEKRRAIDDKDSPPAVIDRRQTRIVLVVPSFPKLSETFIANKFQGLLEKGWDAHVVCDTSEPDEWQRFPQLNGRAGIHARVHTGWPHRPRWLASLLMPAVIAASLLHHPRALLGHARQGWARWGLRTLRRIFLDAAFLKLRPALIHFEFGTLALDRIHLKQILSSRIVVSFRGYDLNFVGLEDPNYYAPVWAEADALHFLGEDLWRRARRRGCPPEKPHALIAPAIDAHFFNPSARAHRDVAGTRERPLNILSVGRLEWKKGYEFALRATQLLRHRGLHCDYQIVGSGAYLEAVAFARHQMGLTGSVQILGPLSPPEVRDKMRRADVFLHAAVSEGFCNAVLEAQAMMLPVVCSDADGLAENVADGVTGFVVPRRDPQAMADKLSSLADSPALRQRLGEAARQRVLAQFRLPDQIDAFDRLYCQLLAAAAGAPRSK